MGQSSFFPTSCFLFFLLLSSQGVGGGAFGHNHTRVFLSTGKEDYSGSVFCSFFYACHPFCVLSGILLALAAVLTAWPPLLGEGEGEGESSYYTTSMK